MKGRRTTLGRDRGHAAYSAAFGITDLMTSLAIIFVLLLVVFANSSRMVEAHPERSQDQVKALLQTHFEPYGLSLQADPQDPLVLRVIVPESLVNFEFGKSVLTPAADRFLSDVMPVYAATMCGPLRDRIAGVVIEGHTDDLGADALNLRLSQERSFRVLVRGLEILQATDSAASRCFQELASASGRGKQDLIYDGRRQPNRDLSRRVVFKIRLRAV